MLVNLLFFGSDIGIDVNYAKDKSPYIEPTFDLIHLATLNQLKQLSFVGVGLNDEFVEGGDRGGMMG